MPKKQAIVVGVGNDALTGTPAQRLKALKLLQEIGAFDRTVADHRLTPEIEQERAIEVLDQLIAEGKRDEEMKHLFADFD